MGLFGGKKDKLTVKITDFYSAEDLQKISETIEPKLAANEYKAIPQITAKGLMDYVKRPEKEYSYSKFSGFIKIAATVKTFEPSLEKILQDGIDKYIASANS